MKKIIILLSLVFFIPSVSFAAIPITDAPVAKKALIEKTTTPDEVVKDKKKSKKIKRLYKKVLKKMGARDAGSGEGSLLNILSFVLAMLGLLLLVVGGGLFSVPLSIAAIILGVLGLKKGQGSRGLGIAGIAIGGGVLFLFLLLIVLLASLLN